MKSFGKTLKTISAYIENTDKMFCFFPLKKSFSLILNVDFPIQYVFICLAMEIAMMTFHQRIILKIQKQAGVLTYT